MEQQLFRSQVPDPKLDKRSDSDPDPKQIISFGFTTLMFTKFARYRDSVKRYLGHMCTKMRNIPVTR
jgi:hypothetical protein